MIAHGKLRLLRIRQQFDTFYDMQNNVIHKQYYVKKADPPFKNAQEHAYISNTLL